MGVLAYGRVDVLACWRVGVLACWRVGVLASAGSGSITRTSTITRTIEEVDEALPDRPYIPKARRRYADTPIRFFCGGAVLSRPTRVG
jgi:hypothetical protein